MIVAKITTCCLFYTQEEETSQEVAAPEAHVSQAEGVSGSQEEAGSSEVQQVPRPRLSTISQVPPLQMRPPAARRRRREAHDESLQVIREAAEIMRAPLNPTECYSAFVANELNQGGEEQKSLARDIINQVLARMKRDELTRDTVLWDPAWPAPHHPPPATSAPPARVRGRTRGSFAARKSARKSRR